MKNLFLILITVTIVACKSNTKENTNSPQEETSKNDPNNNVLNKFNLPDMTKWIKKGITVSDDSEFSDLGLSYLVSREDKSASAYIAISDVKLIEGSTYRVSIVAKRDGKNRRMGLRMTSVYPNRADVLFDVGNGSVVKTSGIGDFERVRGEVEDLGNGWYKCAIIADIFSTSIRVAFGPTNSSRKIASWEGVINENCTIKIIPSTLVAEELLR
jgi:hypothetical protein